MFLANTTLTELKTIRSNIDEYFHDIYITSSDLAQKMDFSISIPRKAHKQNKWR